MLHEYINALDAMPDAGETTIEAGLADVSEEFIIARLWKAGSLRRHFRFSIQERNG
jgi:hypothetical protein